MNTVSACTCPQDFSMPLTNCPVHSMEPQPEPIFDSLHEAAILEVARAIPTKLTGITMIMMSDVEELMVLAFKRGASWQKERT